MLPSDPGELPRDSRHAIFPTSTLPSGGSLDEAKSEIEEHAPALDHPVRRKSLHEHTSASALRVPGLRVRRSVDFEEPRQHDRAPEEDGDASLPWRSCDRVVKSALTSKADIEAAIEPRVERSAASSSDDDDREEEDEELGAKPHYPFLDKNPAPSWKVPGSRHSTSPHSSRCLGSGGEKGGSDDERDYNHDKRRGSRVSTAASATAPVGIYGRWRVFLMGSSLYKRFESAIVSLNAHMNDVTLNVIFGCIVMVVSGLLLVLLLWLLLGQTLPEIMIYNMTHACMAAFARFFTMASVHVVNQVCLAREATTLIKKGVGFTAVFPARKHAKKGDKFRTIVLTLGFTAEIVLTAVGLGLHWTPVMEPIMTGSCIPADYYGVDVKFPNNFGQFLEGDSDFAQLYNYGLPLANGIIGGWAAWPLVTPSDSFSVRGAGVGFLVGVECGDPVLNTNVSVTDHATYFSVEHQLFIESLFNFVVTVTVPANSHSYAPLAAHPIKQQCAVRLAPVEVDVEFSFVSDEWLMVTGGQIIQLDVRSPHGRSLEITQEQSHTYTFDDVTVAYGNASAAVEDGLDILPLMSKGLHLIAQESPYMPTQEVAYANLLRWATLPDGLYHPELMWRGVSAIAGATGHYVTMQYNSSAKATCTYMGHKGSGRIVTAYPLARDIVTALVGLTTLMVLLQAAGWFVSRSAKHARNVQRGVHVLTDPMVALHALWDELAELVPENVACGMEWRRVEAEMRAVGVRLGECKATRGEDVGVIKLGATSKVVKLAPGREYRLPSMRRQSGDEKEALTALSKLGGPRRPSPLAPKAHSLSSVGSGADNDGVTLIKQAILRSSLYATAMKATQAWERLRDEPLFGITCVTLIMLTALVLQTGLLWCLIGRETGDIMIGNTDFARVYQYGLPLLDGVIGGWPAWPVDTPMSEFSITASGIGYRISAICDDPIPVDPATVGLGTGISVSNLVAISTETILEFNVTLPAGSHSYRDPATAILQVCTVKLGELYADISYDFKVDEWARKTTVTMNSVAVKGIAFELGTSAEHTYGQVPAAGAKGSTFDLSAAIASGLELLNSQISLTYPWARVLATALVGLVGFLVVFHLLVWVLTRNLGESSAINSSVNILKSPLRAVVAIREEAASLMHINAEDVVVRLAKNSTRENAVGKLKLCRPSNI
ncbi:hypothetical protein HK101_004782 [Irineochytrium annulatum]|nr:hypothetical protein HK101_004782 [Irineochytrium annulatum]